MKKVVFLKVSRGGYESGSHTTALVLQKTADGYLSIQGHSPVAWSERHKCWQLFRRAAKSLLGVCEALPVSVSLSEPPHSAVSDLADVFRQPSHIVSLTLSPLPHESELEREADRRKNERQAAAAGRACCSYSPTPAASGLYQPARASPLSSPQARRRANKNPGEGRREMDRLLVQLDEVGQSLERTQSRCEDIARRCEGIRAAGEEGGCDEPDWASDDQRVERLLRVAESLTAQIISGGQRRSPAPTGPATTGVSSPRQPGGMMSSERGGVPEPPSDVSAQPNLNGGLFVFWRPVRLDDRDRNNGRKVTGYAVYVDGVQRSKVAQPFGSHVEIDGLESGVQYQIQVRTLSAEGSESLLSQAVQYRHEVRVSSSLPPASSTPPPTQQLHNRQSSKVENWLLSSQTPTRLSPSHALPNNGTPVDETTPPGHTHLSEDTWSMGSSHTSGIVMDHPPGSQKLTPSCPSFYHGDGFSVHSGATTLIVDGQTTLSPHHHHQLRFSSSPSPSPSATPSRGRSLTPKQGVDALIDEPLDFNSITAAAEETEIGKAAATVALVAGSRHRGPAPPGGVQVSQRQPGWLHVTWTPTKRDGKGCSNGCFVLGYRVYINGSPRASVDGPMTYETSLRWPHLPDSPHKLEISMRTRSIAAESLPSTPVLYDMLLQESVEKYLGAKVNSPLSSTTTLCPSNSVWPRPLRNKQHSPTRSQRSDARETYV